MLENEALIVAGHTFLRASSRRSARSQARSTAAHSASVSCWPDEVVAVTSTLIITAAGSTPARSTFVGSYPFQTKTSGQFLCNTPH